MMRMQDRSARHQSCTNIPDDVHGDGIAKDFVPLCVADAISPTIREALETFAFRPGSGDEF